MRPKNTPVSRQKSSRTTQKAFHIAERLVLLWFAIADYYALHRLGNPVFRSSASPTGIEPVFYA